MLLRRANSSFILPRRLLSIRLWAVFLAILRPAALVALGCFFFPPWAPLASPTVLLLLVAALFAVPADALAPALPESLADEDSTESCCVRGFIWMIFLDLVGGGGRAKEGLSLPSYLVADDRRRDLTVSAACNGYAARGDEEESSAGG